MVKIRCNEQIGDVIDRSIAWPRNEKLDAVINGMLEIDRDLALLIEEEVNALLGQAARAGFVAGFAAGRHPERLIFAELQ